MPLIAKFEMQLASATGHCSRLSKCTETKSPLSIYRYHSRLVLLASPLRKVERTKVRGSNGPAANQPSSSPSPFEKERRPKPRVTTQKFRQVTRCRKNTGTNFPAATVSSRISVVWHWVSTSLTVAQFISLIPKRLQSVSCIPDGKVPRSGWLPTRSEKWLIASAPNPPT